MLVFILKVSLDVDIYFTKNSCKAITFISSVSLKLHQSKASPEILISILANASVHVNFVIYAVIILE